MSKTALTRINGLIVGKMYIARFEARPNDYALVNSRGDQFGVTLEQVSAVLVEGHVMPAVGDFVFITFDGDGQIDSIHNSRVMGRAEAERAGRDDF